MKVLPLNRIEVRYIWQVAMFAQHGYRVKYYPDSNKFFMIRTVH